MMKVNVVFCLNYACPDPAVPTVKNSTPSVSPAVTPSHSSLSLQTNYPLFCVVYFSTLSAPETVRPRI
jgi:hypothetical protein